MLDAWHWAAGEGMIVLTGLGVACLAALLPVWQAYRVDVAQLLNRS